MGCRPFTVFEGSDRESLLFISVNFNKDPLFHGELVGAVGRNNYNQSLLAYLLSYLKQYGRIFTCKSQILEHFMEASALKVKDALIPAKARFRLPAVLHELTALPLSRFVEGNIQRRLIRGFSLSGLMGISISYPAADGF